MADQIRQQQEAFAKVATAIARAKEAEQDAITVEKRGQANAAEAKWKQEVVKAQQVTEAEMRKRVAELDAEAAAATKRKLILEGEGEAAKRLLVMQADGALERKLATYERVQGVWAGAFKEFKGSIVPQIMMTPGVAGAGGNAALDFMGLMGMKAARDLSLDLSTTAGPKR